MRMFELLPRPLGAIFRKLTHLTCNLPWEDRISWEGDKGKGKVEMRLV